MKFQIITLLLLTNMFIVNGQNLPVSTSPQNRVAVIEEFTGINCPNCAKGNLLSNNIMSAHANAGNNVFTINIHATSFASPNGSQPNYKTTEGNAIRSYLNVNATPTGPVNRIDQNASGTFNYAGDMDANDWVARVQNVVDQVADVNIAMDVTINGNLLTVNVELYYTTNHPGTIHKLSVGLMQNNILGPQSKKNDNPAQVVGNQYSHRHMLRTYINDVWGDTVDAGIQGVISRTFQYTIPSTLGIGNIPVVIDDLEIFALLHEGKGSNAKAEILNAVKVPISLTVSTIQGELSDNSFSIYPNPSSEFISIKNNSETEIQYATIYSSSGQVITNNTLYDLNTKIDISKLPTGLYILVLTTKNGNTYTKKWTKN